MTPDEQRAYSRGYSAGRKRVQREITDRQMKAAKCSAWLEIFSACMPSAMVMQGWKRGEKEIKTIYDRARLAGEFADKGLTELLSRFGPASITEAKDFRPTYSVTGNGTANRKAEDYLADPKVIAALEKISQEADQ